MIYKLKLLSLAVLFFSMFVFTLQAVTIRVKVSAPSQLPEMNMNFPEKQFQLGSKLNFFIDLVKEPGTRVTNIYLIENYNFDERTREITNYTGIDRGMDALFSIQYSKLLTESGIYEYRIRMSGVKEDGSGFSRYGIRQISVEEGLSDELFIREEIGPFVYKKDSLVWRENTETSVEQIVGFKNIREKIDLILSLPSHYQIKIIGYTDSYGPEEPEGDKPGNVRISENRARQVAEIFMQKYNIPETRILIQGKGSQNEKFRDRPGAVINRNRRVLILFP